MSVAMRFWVKVNIQDSGSCWEWLASKQNRGYGQFNLNGSMRLAHRMAYEFIKGPIPDGLVLDHLCSNPGCVNPTHLEAVTQSENCRRGRNGEHMKGRTHCKNGHEFSEENTYTQKRGSRVCRTCRREWTREWLRKRHP